MSHHHHHPTPPTTTQQPPSPPPLNHLPPPSPHHNSITITHDDDQYEQQQLISNLLSLSPSSDKTMSFQFQQQVKFVSYPYFLPFESSSSSYITINGNEETCGSSFSDTDSSVMASFDTTACFLFSDAFSGYLLTPHDIDDDDDDDHLLGASAVALQTTRELHVLDEDPAWDWAVFSGHSQEKD